MHTDSNQFEHSSSDSSENKEKPGIDIGETSKRIAERIVRFGRNFMRRAFASTGSFDDQIAELQATLDGIREEQQIIQRMTQKYEEHRDEFVSQLSALTHPDTDPVDTELLDKIEREIRELDVSISQSREDLQKTEVVLNDCENEFDRIEKDEALTSKNSVVELERWFISRYIQFCVGIALTLFCLINIFQTPFAIIGVVFGLVILTRSFDRSYKAIRKTDRCRALQVISGIIFLSVPIAIYLGIALNAFSYDDQFFHLGTTPFDSELCSGVYSDFYWQ